MANLDKAKGGRTLCNTYPRASDSCPDHIATNDVINITKMTEYSAALCFLYVPEGRRCLESFIARVEMWLEETTGEGDLHTMKQRIKKQDVD